MSNFNSPQMSSDSNLNSKHTSEPLAQTNVINTPIFLTGSSTEISEAPLSTSTEISVTSEDDPATSQDWFNLARKLRGQNRQLLESIVELERSLAKSQQQLQEQEKQARRDNSVTTQQTAQVDNTTTQFKTAQEQFQQQQQELANLQEKLVTTQSQLAHVKRQCTLLKQRYQEKAERLDYSQKQVEELQTRLQRQQRYALQYKAALDECLSKSTRKQVQPSMTSLSSDKTLTPKITSIKTWSEQFKAKKTSESILSEAPPKDSLKQIATSNFPERSEPSSSLKHLDQTFEKLFSVVPETPKTMEKIKNDIEKIPNQKGLKSTSVNVGSKTFADHDSHTYEMVTSVTQESAIQSPASFSFDIDCDKPNDKTKIDLPSFLSRRHQQ